MKTLFVFLILSLAGFSVQLRAETCPDGDYTLATDAELDLFEQIGCTRITGTLTVGGGDSFTVTSAGIDSATDTADVTGLSGLRNLQRVGNLSITYNSALGSLSGIPSELLVTGTLEIANNDSLTSLDGLGRIDASNPDVFRIFNNPSLSNCNVLAPVLGIDSSSDTSSSGSGVASCNDATDFGCGATSATSASAVSSSSSDNVIDLNELCSSPRPTAYNSTQITWDKYCPGYTPTDTYGNDNDADADCSGFGFDCYGDSNDSHSDSTSANSSLDSVVQNNAPGCNSVAEILESVSASRTLQVILESPAAGDTYSGVSTLRGWAVAYEGISKVDIYIDGNFFQSAPYGGKRGDVGSIFPEINDSDESGFALAYNFSGLSAGTHTITVEAATTDGRVLSRAAQFQVTKFPAQFLPADQSPDLSGASCVINDQTVHILDTLVDGSVYDVSLEWRTADQGFQIQEIR